ncbi:unnamed protein product, partial [Vitis vinifera]|uniref:Uncharacterized protein n=1 Tax=Vitis vinifera TaxID=29760 RepID=D7TWJ1_VITVI
MRNVILFYTPYRFNCFDGSISIFGSIYLFFFKP